MKLIRGLSNIKAHHQQPILTIGNFDGIHLGHQAMLKNMVRLSLQTNHPSMVMLFEPSPAEFFNPECPPARITRLLEKSQYIAAHDIDYLLKINFNETLSQMSAYEFIEQILVKQLQVHHLIIGEDFRFGHQRQGNTVLLAQAAQQYGFSLTTFSPVNCFNQRVSSSQIRRALIQGDLATAQQLLGRSFAMSGRVIHGEKRGRLLGVPTANILPKRRQTPLSGVYFAKVHGVGDEALPAVAHIGTQPTVNGHRVLLEVHILNFSGDLYGRRLNIEFLEKIRDIEKFENLDELRVAMNQDIMLAKNYFRIYEK